MLETVKTDVFTRFTFFHTKLSGRVFLMILSSIWEAFWEPGLLTFCFLVAPVANTCLILGSQFPSLIFSVKSDVEESRNGGRGG